MFLSNLPLRVWLTWLVVATPLASNAERALASAVTTAIAPSQWATDGAPKSITLVDGVQLVLATDTQLLRRASVPAPMHIKNMAERTYVLELVHGRVDVDIDMSKQPYYSVMLYAPRRVTAYLKGGRSAVLASKQGVVVAAMTGADISAGNADRWRPIHVGTALAVSRERPTGETRSLLTRPTLAVQSSIILSLGNSKPNVLSWSNVSNARNYRLTLSCDSAGEQGASQTFELTQTSFELPTLKPGRCSATVSAFDAWRLNSAESNHVAVRVIGVELPEGAYLHAGVPQLGEFQSVRFTHAGGLEMAYGSGNVFGPAPESIHLSAGRPLLARLREVGTTQEVALLLEPRAVGGSIAFAPARAKWPGKPISVSVSISGPAGAPLSNSIDVNLITSINSDAIDVDWHRAGNSWTAQIAQPPRAGPWVLRVTATDQAGQVLARDFIEIALSEKPLTSSAAGSRYSSR
jgi:hypothetical protein